MSYRYRKEVLDNGLRVVTVEAPHVHTAMIAVYVRTGSRHETPATNGVSHFLEHMFFRGSARYPDTVRMNAAIEDVGGNLNGITTRDHGYYFTPIHPAHLSVGIAILGDMLQTPRLPDIEVERKVILEEMLDEVDERGEDIDIDNLCKRALFANHPLALKIAGTRASVRAISRRQLRAHHARHYVATNLVFAASGRVRHDETLELVHRAFGRLPRGEPSTEKAPSPPRPGPRLEFVEHGEAQTEFRLTFQAVPEQHADFPALQLLRRILDDGLSSRLPYEIVERRGLAYSVGAALEAYHDVGIFELDAACAPAHTASVFEVMVQQLARLCANEVSTDELLRAQRRHRMLLEFAQDSPSELAGWFGGTELFRAPESFEQRCHEIESQTPRRLREVAAKYLTRTGLCVVAVGQRRGMRALRAAVKRAELPK